MAAFLERHKDKISGVLSCFDRIVIQGTLPGICYSQGMTAYLYRNKIRIFDYKKCVEPLRDEIKANAERIAKANGMKIEFIRKTKQNRKEKLIKEILAKRGDHPGLVHIFSAMESCSCYKPWHDKKTHQNFVKPDTGRCLHYYFYFIDEQFGLCYLRVPTWCPFRLQFYFNGHNWLARQLNKAGINFHMIENAFVNISDFTKAQSLAEAMDVRRLHKALDKYARQYCPAMRHFGVSYHWSLMQVEYALDILFKQQDDLAPIYEAITRTAIHAVKAENVATFLGRKLSGNYRDELGNNFSTRIEGTCIRHYMAKSGIKMYDKFNIILRIESTANDISFFKHHRKVEHRDGTSSYKIAPLKKNIYSLHALKKILDAANRRYLEFISAIDDPSTGIKDLNKISQPVSQNGRNYKGFNFFAAEDQQLFKILARGEHNLSGMRNKDIRKHMPDLSSSKVSRIIKRLRTHGMLKRVGRTYKYYFTKLGRKITVTGLKLKTMFLIPELATARSEANC